MKPMSFKAELAWASFVTTTFALLLAGTSLLLFEFFAYKNRLVSDLVAQADLLAHSTATALAFDDRKAAAENLGMLKLRPEVSYGAVLKADGTEFAAYRKALVQAPPLRRDADLEARGARLDSRVVEVAYPVELDGEQLGHVYLHEEHDLLARGLSYLGILLGVLVAALGLGNFVFSRLQERVTHPLSVMAATAQQVIATRDWSLRAPAARNVELNALVQAFNRMLEEVNAATGQLERSNRLLALETEERRLAEERLKVLDRRKDEFIAMLAHELRNPLAPMMNSAALLRSATATAAMKDRASSIIERQLLHMSRLINDLLDVSRIMTGKLSLVHEQVDIRQAVQQALELVEPAIRSKQQGLSLQLPGDAPVLAVGDSARLNQIFVNLLNNANKYTPVGGSIEVGVEERGGFAEVRVSDSGIGIDPAMQARVFELFEQVDKSLERGSAGLGIGLTLAQQLAHLHGGDIKVHSEGLGRGACFTVRIPAARQQLPAPAAPATGPAATQPLKVLVADDNVDHAQSLAVILEAAGHRVRVVHDGVSAMDAINDDPPDLALVDIGMPGMNGYDVARRVRQVHPAAALKLVAITGWGHASDVQEARRAGFDVHLVKPVPVEELLATLQGVRQPDAAQPAVPP